jgi:ATP-dependent RNA helicase DeaD
MTFEELGLRPELLRAIKDLGFEKPTPIQERTIPAIMENKEDIVALAQTGTGKTAGFGLPIQQSVDTSLEEVQALILSPTRELCVQIGKDLESYSKYIPDIKQTTVYGGADISKQIRDLKKRPQIVVGTPGRMLDLIKRKALKVNNISYLVLDEADEMLNMGFKEELDNILETTPSAKRTFLFSATMPKEVLRIANEYMHESIEISVGNRNAGAENVEHLYYMVNARDRYEALKRIADINPAIYGIVFCRTRAETKEIAEKLKNDGYNADALHGDLSQAQRDYVMNGFRKKHLQMLVATDVAARGLDVNDLTHVINFKMPDELETYIHRSGRTGRAGKSGISITIVHSREVNKIRTLEKLVGKKITKAQVPKGSEICEKQLFNLIDRMENIEVDESQIGRYMDVIYKKLEWLSREDLIKRFVSVEFNRFLSYYKNAPDLNISEKAPRNGRSDRDNWESHKEKNIRQAKEYSRFFINIGAKHKVAPPILIGLINDYTKRRNIGVGKIDIMKGFSFFEVDKKFEKDVLNGFKDAQFKGYKLSVELSKPDKKASRSSAPKKRFESGRKRRKY